jgi:hypothetical protein
MTDTVPTPEQLREQIAEALRKDAPSDDIRPSYRAADAVLAKMRPVLDALTAERDALHGWIAEMESARAAELEARRTPVTVSADVEALRAELIGSLREYETNPYGDLRLNADRVVAKVLTAIAEHPVVEIRPYYPTQDAYDAACAALEKHRQRADQAEADLLKVIDERDEREALLDRFAAKVAPVEVIGEHSSGNDPWANAMEMVTPAAEVERLRAAAATLGALEAAGVDNWDGYAASMSSLDEADHG